MIVQEASIANALVALIASSLVLWVERVTVSRLRQIQKAGDECIIFAPHDALAIADAVKPMEKRSIRNSCDDLR